MIFSTKPPTVSKPSESGMTSNNSTSSPVLLPASVLACIAAPSATTLSGSKLVSGAWPKNSATASLICGIRVAPPTNTTPVISHFSSAASRMAFLVGLSVFCTKVCVRAKNCLSERFKLTTSPVVKTQVICALG